MSFKIVITAGIAVACMALIGFAIFAPERHDSKPADPQYAEALLKNFAKGMIILSVKNGGNGKANFASDLSEIKPYVMTKAHCALPGEGQTSYGGYVVRLEEFPAGDGFKSNFLLVAYPATGYTGASFAIDKSEEIKEYNQN